MKTTLLFGAVTTSAASFRDLRMFYPRGSTPQSGKRCVCLLLTGVCRYSQVTFYACNLFTNHPYLVNQALTLTLHIWFGSTRYIEHEAFTIILTQMMTDMDTY